MGAVNVARSLREEGLASDKMAGLASLHNKNAERDLHRWLRGYGSLQLEPFYLTLMLEKPDSYELEETKVPVLQPTEIVHAIWQSNPGQFEVSFLDHGGESSCREFWAWAMTQKWGRAHPVLRKNI